MPPGTKRRPAANGCLAVLAATDPEASHGTELTVPIVADFAAVLRFAVLRSWAPLRPGRPPRCVHRSRPRTARASTILHGHAAPEPTFGFRSRWTDRPRWERPAFRALLLATGPYTSGARRFLIRQLVLLRGRAGRRRRLEGVPLRLARRGNTIAIDKRPGALWPMGLSVRSSRWGVDSCWCVRP
ncbi:hypothetical protein [Streptomyces xiaopingdaonensis]|uniref:hypothetical protein n=1 Tax=Streptomyces xiaopingdaonensis TaxID=1565415 RepID=UPI001872FEE2|nr:hypothetical protein [Streptomyces xiaopingdaonensis]